MAEHDGTGDELDDGGTAYLFHPSATGPSKSRPEGEVPPPVEATTRAFGTDVPAAEGAGGPGTDDLQSTLAFTNKTPLVSNSSPKPGDVLFNKYVVEKKLGEGGMGSVWLVRHMELNTPRALKMIVSGVAIDPQSRERFRREARVMASFSHHPNAVAVHDALVTDSAAFIDMEVVRGESIDKFLKPGVPMPLGWISRVLGQLCEVLQEAHDQGIVHRDLSPSNLMILEGYPEGYERLKVLDFGIAKIIFGDNAEEESTESLTEPGGFLGKPAYASPEQIEGRSIDGRSDLYTVGVMLYEFLTGFRPFSGNRIKLIHAHWHSPPPPFSEINPAAAVPAEIERVVMRCLAKSPDARPQTARDLADEFFAALTPSSASAFAAVQPGGDYRDEATEVAGMTAVGHAVDPTGLSNRPAEHRQGSPPIPQTGTNRRLPLLAVASATLFLVGAGIWLATRPARPGASTTEVSTGSSSSASSDVPTPDVADPVQKTIDRKLAEWRGLRYKPADVPPRKGGWPKFLVREPDGTRFVRSSAGCYIPEGYHPGKARAEDGWPKTLVREGDFVEFVRIVGDSFPMGGVAGSQTMPDDPSYPTHPVTLSGFYIQRHEVSNGEVEAYLTNEGRPRASWPTPWASLFGELATALQGDNKLASTFPAVGIPWNFAADFARAKGGLLPTEAQWEFAARSRGKADRARVWAGDRAKRDLEIKIDDVGQGATLTSPVGSSKDDVTEQGIRDMAANAREWCRDVYYAPYPTQPDTDPEFELTDANRKEAMMVVRGGSYKSTFDELLTRFRPAPLGPFEKGASIADVGFRLVLECPPESLPAAPQ